jgi:bile acid:Na+ symporter, BASS family
LLSERWLVAAKPALKLVNMIKLLVLCYSNAAVALPRTVADPDWDFLLCMLLVVLAMCVLGFGTGWLVARIFRADESRPASLIFGLGMTNNGTGLVLAASALSHLPGAVLPVIFYNLVQHIVAAYADRCRQRG